MQKILLQDVKLFIYILSGIIKYKKQLKNKPLSQIINEIHELKSKDLNVKYPELFLLNRIHAICRKVQMDMLHENKPCLIRALIIYEICIRNGIKVHLIIGTHKKGTQLEGHAWIEYEGKPFKEDYNLNQYHEVIRY